MKKSFAIAVGASALLLGSLIAAPAGAQSTQTTRTTQTTTVNGQDVVGPHNPYCGAWMDGTWTPNGNCTVETTTTTTTTGPGNNAAMRDVATGPANGLSPERITGTIIAINGHLVTLQHGDRTLIVDDGRALNREDTGHVTMGRGITAHGYWEDGTFYANRFE